MKLNFLDRAIGLFSPEAAYRRGRFRAALDVAGKRGYEGASKGRRTGNWRSASSSADAQIAESGALLRDRMRQLVRDNPHAAKAVSTLVTHIVGDGIWPRTTNAKLNELFKTWAQRCDADGQLDWAGLQTLAVRGMVEGGETLVRRRTRTRNRAGVPLQLQVLEADHLADAKDGVIADRTGRTIQGIEFNSLGTRVAYWLHPTHPGNGWAMTDLDAVRVPAGDICHLYEKQRTQVRGVPWGSPVIAKLGDLGDYDDAELMRKKLEACFVGVVINGDEDDLGIGLKVPRREGDGESLEPGVYDGTGALVERFEPGMFAHARGGKDIKFNSPAQNGSHAEFKNVELHAVAAGFRVPYELLTGDLSNVSFISGRLGLHEFYRLVSVIQWQVVIPMFLQPAWEWFLDAAYLAGLIESTDVAVEWGVPKLTSLDPLSEGKADLIDLRMGKKTFAELCAERGRDPKDVIKEIAEMNNQLDAAGIILDGDPRRVTAAGLFQQDSDGTDPEAKPAKPAKAKKPASAG